MNQLQVIVHRQARVLTTGQLAESYGTDNRRIAENFNANKNRYKQEKHFFLVEGEELKALKNEYGNSVVAPTANKFYLWTEKGAWLHAKSLNTDAAWDAYEMLVDEYYKVIEQKPLTAREQLHLIMQANEETAQRVDVIEETVSEVKVEIEDLRDNLYITSLQAKTIRNKVGEKVYESLGGKESNAFKHLKNKLFVACWRDFKNYFGINEYRELPRVKFEHGLKFLLAWQPSTEIRLEIEHYNTQLVLNLVKQEE